MGSTDPGNTRFAPRDFLRTPGGLYFAIVAGGLENGRVLSTLRYQKTGATFHKLNPEQSRRLLEAQHPEFLYRSPIRDVSLHGVPVDVIEEHLVPSQRAAEILRAEELDPIERKAVHCLKLFEQQGIRLGALGVTGSLLIGAQHPDSDIDFVVTDREVFARVRSVIKSLLDEAAVDPLTSTMWRTTHARRGCSLPVEDYIWHERRKFNKLVLDGTKIDVSLALRTATPPGETFRKLERVELTARVTDDRHSFDYPAVWTIDSPLATCLICWTPTYTGQAVAGETVRIQGWLEESEFGQRQIIVGTSREAEGELIAVVRRVC